MARNCPHQFVLFTYDKPLPNGNIYSIYKCYDEDMVWDSLFLGGAFSPGVEVRYFDTYKQAQAAVAANKGG